MKQLQVGKQTAEMLRRGHPWVLADRYTAVWPGGLGAGELVCLVDEGGEALGTAMLDPAERIVARLLDRGPVRFGEEWLAARLEQALALRERLIDAELTNALRLVNGEGDLLPGLTLDRYDDYLLLQTYTDAWLPHLGTLTRVLEALLRPRGVIHKSRPQQTRPRAGGGDEPPPGRLLCGSAPPAPLEVFENGVHFGVDLSGGLHTGLFLDQRSNRSWVQKQAGGERFLNLFCYTGAFSVAAALGGARQTVSVDLSSHYLDQARENFGRNRLNPKRHRFVAGDCRKVLQQLARDGESFGMILFDPPSFSTSRQGRFSVRDQTAELTEQSLRLLRPDGLLLASCNLARLSEADYLKELSRGARQAGCRLQILSRRGQGVDFPSLAGFPEGHYLKFVIGRKLP